MVTSLTEAIRWLADLDLNDPVRTAYEVGGNDVDDGDPGPVDAVEEGEDSPAALIDRVAVAIRLRTDQHSWRQWAACAGADPNLWHPERPEEGETDPQAKEARAICAQCPVVVKCLEAALAAKEELGQWGGSSRRLRRRLRPVFLARAHDFDADCDDPGCSWCVKVRDHIGWLDGGGGPRQLNGTSASHGIRATYAKGCRCPSCRFSATQVGQDLARAGQDTRRWWAAIGWLEPQDATRHVAEIRRDHRECGVLVVERLAAAFPVAVVCPRHGRFEAPEWRVRDGELAA